MLQESADGSYPKATRQDGLMRAGPNDVMASGRSAKRLDRRGAIKLLGTAAAGATLAPRWLRSGTRVPSARTSLRPLASGTLPRSLTATELRARRETADIPIIFMTGCGDRDLREAAWRIGGCAFFVKPYEPSVLVSAVCEMLGRGPAIELAYN